MPYRFAKERQDYSDYSGGRVFYSLPDHPAFPIRLASEIFQRCAAIREANGATAPCTLYDPCCGGAYHLGTLAYLHWHAIAEIIASDVDEQPLSLAKRNLALLTLPGIEQRIAEITQMLSAYNKPSHAAALKSAHALKNRLSSLTDTHPIKTSLFRADATDGQALVAGLGNKTIDVVITDVPYGQHSNWQTRDSGQPPAPSPVWQMLEALLDVVSPHTIVAVAADKQQKIAHPGYRRLERFRMGKRQIVLLGVDS